ncbi:MAG: glycerol-3-phosphate dehydrogenase [Candidatus Dormiibacter spiritus]|nr:MAG: glycerol-3-phosphate dehydrogenase [Candidatus Dormibacteraeota bacterium]
MTFMDRDRTRERLSTEEFDLVVMGAGVIGARIAFEAAHAGAKVALIDARDFGSATSSASSKLIHGGLRYLQMYDFGLVHEAHQERAKLLDRIAPHLVKRLDFVIPVFKGGPHNVPMIAGAMLTYAALSGFRHSHSRMVGRKGAQRLIPALQGNGFRAAGVYEDAQTHDSRIVLATVQAAAQAGAAVMNHLPVTELEILSGRVTGVRCDGLRIGAKQVINATGPWVDRIRLLEDPDAEPMARLSKGVHLVLDAPQEPWHAALTTPLPGGRVTFAVPWEGMLLLGTTDTEYGGDPAALAVTPDDVDTILAEAATGLPAELLARERIRYTFAGLRVLPKSDGTTSGAKREEVVRTGPAGMVSVAGGKLTTHRQIALKVLRHLPDFSQSGITDEPLPGQGPLPERPVEVEPRIWDHLTHLYGDRAAHVASLGLEPIHPDGPDIWGQVHQARSQEWAQTVDDVIRRRTTLQIRGLATDDVRRRIDATLSSEPVLQSVDGP